MHSKFALNKGNSGDIAFANAALTACAVSFDEFKEWIYFLIQECDELPLYVYSILDVKEKFDYTLRQQEVIGFTAYWDGKTKKEYYALIGIAYKRNVSHISDACDREEALQALRDNPHIEQRFRETFPFIDS